MSHLLHHIDSPIEVIRQSKRVVKASGAILIRYGAIEQIRDDAEHRFFPEAFAIDEARTPTVKMVEEWLRAASLTNIISEEVIQQTYDTGMARLNAVKLRDTSVLNIISQEAFKKGVNDLEKYIENNPNDNWLLFDRLTITVGYKDE